MRSLFIFIFFTAFVTAPVFAQQKLQDKQELERKRQETLKEIEDINAALKEVQKGKKQSLAELILAKKKLALRQNVIEIGRAHV